MLCAWSAPPCPYPLTAAVAYAHTRAPTCVLLPDSESTGRVVVVSDLFPTLWHFSARMKIVRCSFHRSGNGVAQWGFSLLMTLTVFPPRLS